MILLLHALQRVQGLLSNKEKHEVRSDRETLINLLHNVKSTLVDRCMRIHQVAWNKDYAGTLVMGVPSMKVSSPT